MAKKKPAFQKFQKGTQSKEDEQMSSSGAKKGSAMRKGRSKRGKAGKVGKKQSGVVKPNPSSY